MVKQNKPRGWKYSTTGFYGKRKAAIVNNRRYKFFVFT